MTTLLKEIYVGNVYGNWYLRLYEDSISQSIDGNYTNVALRLTLYASSTTWASFDNRDAWIGGTHFSIAYRHDNAEHSLGTTTLRVDHNADGTGSYNIGFGMSTSYVLNGSGSGGRTLPTIPRASSFTISSNNTLGSVMSVSISRASSSFTHTVRYQFGSIVREYSKQGTSCSFTPPYTDGSQIPNSTSGTGTITVYTYSGSTHVGTKSATFTLSVNQSVFVPTFSGLSVTRVDNGVPDAWGIYVQYKSKATAQIQGASATYGASISSYLITIGSASGGNNFTAGPFSAGIITITGKITDSRGLSSTQTKQITVYENTPPTLSIKAERCNSAGTSMNDGTYIKITPTYSCASINGKNYISSKMFKINGTSYQNTTGASGASFILGSNAIVVSKAYVVSGIVTDALGQKSSQIEVNVPTSSVPFHVRENQDGVAFGKYSERVGIDSAWPVYVNGTKLLSSDENAQGALKLQVNGNIPLKESGLYYWQSANRTDVFPNTGWHHLLRMQHPGYDKGYFFDLIASFDTNGLYWRTNRNGSWTGFAQVYDTFNCPFYNSSWWIWRFPNGLQIAIFKTVVNIRSNSVGNDAGFEYCYFTPPDYTLPFINDIISSQWHCSANDYLECSISFRSGPSATNASGGVYGYINVVGSSARNTTRTYTIMNISMGRWN